MISGPDVLHLCGAVHADAARDVPEEARNAEAHVRRVAKERQYHCRNAHDRPRDHYDPIHLFHFVSPHNSDFMIWSAPSAVSNQNYRTSGEK